MYNLTGVVKNLIIINVIIFLAVSLPFFQQFRHFFILYPIGGPSFEPVQLVTHMFNHGSITHLFFNMMALFFFGPPVEQMWGPKKFLAFYFIAGLGAVFFHVLFGSLNPVLGASGAISGVLLAFAVLFPEAKVMLLIPPIPLKAKYLVMILLGIDLFLGITRSNTGIAHFAHIGGAAFGFLMIFIWRKFPGFMR